MTQQPGWYPDPTGRFGHRWHDGNDWTDTVLGANSQPLTDPYPRRVPVPPPPAAGPASGPAFAPPEPTAPVPASGPPVAIAAGPAPSGGPNPVAIGVVGAGLLAVVLSLFVLEWAGGGGFLDARDGVADLRGSAVDTLLRLSLQFGSFLVLAAAGATAVVAALRVSAPLTTIAAGLAGLGAVVHTFIVVRLFRFPGVSPELGAWLGTIGYFAVVAGIGVAVLRPRT